MMQCKEHLLYFFLQGKVSLSQYDHKFLSNLQMMIHKGDRVTTNQAALFDKLISKYTKQLTKLGLIKEELKSLPWKAEVVESSPEFTGARVELIETDDQIGLRVPFNKNFISEFRDVPHNPFLWVRDEKMYRAPFSTEALKILYINLPKFFSSIIYSPVLHHLIKQIEEYNAKIWEPTLTKIGDSLMLVGVSEHLWEHVSDIELKLDARTLFSLSKFGIKVDPDIIGTDPKLKFASEFITEIDLEDLTEAASWMVELGVDRAMLGRGLLNNRTIKQEVLDKLDNFITSNSFQILKNTHNVSNVAPLLLQYHKIPDTRSYYHDESISKCVIIRNSRPIEVK